MLPLYFILVQVIVNRELFVERINVALLVVVGAYALLSVGVLMFTGPIVQSMGQAKLILKATVSYIRLESFALLLSSVYVVVAVVVLVLQKQAKLMYGLLIIKTVLIVLFDSLFVSQLPISFQLGVNRVA